MKKRLHLSLITLSLLFCSCGIHYVVDESTGERIEAVVELKEN